MVISRRRMLAAGAAGLLIPVVARSGSEITIPTLSEVPLGKFYGDFDYRHDEYHAQYQLVFGLKLACACGAGDCRVTVWRRSILNSSHGIDVIVNREWMPLMQTVRFPKPEDIPPVLTRDWAHVCAYPIPPRRGEARKIDIPCAIINEKQG